MQAMSYKGKLKSEVDEPTRTGLSEGFGTEPPVMMSPGPSTSPKVHTRVHRASLTGPDKHSDKILIEALKAQLTVGAYR